MKPSKNHGAANDELVIPLAEENARIEKRQGPTRTVRIQTLAEDVQEIVSATLKGEMVDIVRVPVDSPVSKIPETRTENGVTIIPIVEEVLFVEKRLVLKEELHLRRQPTKETVALPVTLKKQRAVVERVAEETNPTESKE
jgi:stress response protein YsnF